MPNIKLVLAYFGSSFMGWQKTNMGPSIEEALEQALQQILQDKVKLQAASRTDAGVHAEGQVVNFLMKEPRCLSRLRYSLNGLLPKEISVLSAEEMPETFHPTLDSFQKEYWYHLCYAAVQMPFFRQTSWHFPYSLDLDLMREEAKYLIGTHDFSAFCNERQLWDRSPICTIEKIELVSLPKERLQFIIVGDHFLYKMVRNIVGTFAYVGCGKLARGALPEILSSKDRKQAGMTAPAHGLVLKRVIYPG
jgi:tRNA pseudouridine38-40 synthase